MNPKQSLRLLAAVAAVIAAIAIWQFGVKPGLEKKTVEAGVFFPGFDQGKVDRIEISRGEILTALVRQGDSVWAVETADNYRADADAVERALTAVAGLRKDLPASENKDNHSRLGVDDQGLKVRLLDGKTVLAELIVGESGKNYGTSYLRAAGSDAVYLVSEDLPGVFDHPASDWRDKKIFDLEPEDVKEVRLWTDPNAKPEPAAGSTAAPAVAAGSTAAGPPESAAAFPAITPNTPGALVIQRSAGGEWVAALPGDTTEKLDTGKTDALVRGLTTLTAVAFADTVSPEQAGLQKPTRRVEFITNDGQTYTLLVGAEGGNDFFVQRPDRKVIFRVYPYNVDNIFKTIEELRPLPGGADAGSMLPPPNIPGAPGGEGGLPPGMVMPGMPEGGDLPTPPPIEPAPPAEPGPAEPAPGATAKAP